jgi:hypothetical protein
MAVVALRRIVWSVDGLLAVAVLGLLVLSDR